MSGKETNKVHILLCYVFNEAGHVCQRIMFCTTIMDLGISFCISVFEGKQVVSGKVTPLSEYYNIAYVQSTKHVSITPSVDSVFSHSKIQFIHRSVHMVSNRKKITLPVVDTR